MMTVEVIKDGLIEGSIQFQGIRVTQPDGSTRIPIGEQGDRVPFAYWCKPDGFLTDTTIRQIALDLSCGKVRGRVHEHEWRVD
jgi:hypothetical protein